MTLYYIQQDSLDQAASILAEAFQEDPLYVYLEADPEKRQLLLPIFFKHYLKLMIPYSHLIADGSALNAIALWYDDSKLDSVLKWYIRSIQAIIGGLSMCKHITPIDYFSKLKILLQMGSAWISDYKTKENWATYLHLDMLVTKRTSRGQGYAHQLMTDAIDILLSENPVSTIETHNINNLAYYNQFGYETVREIAFPKSDLVQYCMIKKQYPDINE